MDTNSIMLDETKKNAFETEISDVLINAAKEGQIPLAEMQKIAQSILPEFRNIKTQTEMMAFLEKISKQWTLFMPLYLKQKGSQVGAKEKEIIDKLSSYIHTAK